jgi:hypothetical protein
MERKLTARNRNMTVQSNQQLGESDGGSNLRNRRDHLSMNVLSAVNLITGMKGVLAGPSC